MKEKFFRTVSTSKNIPVPKRLTIAHRKEGVGIFIAPNLFLNDFNKNFLIMTKAAYERYLGWVSFLEEGDKKRKFVEENVSTLDVELGKSVTRFKLKKDWKYSKLFKKETKLSFVREALGAFNVEVEGKKKNSL